MNTDILALVKDIQDRVREVAYLMWESAGRQHGMALEYWLAAEREVISTMQTAAERMMPGQAPGPEAAKQEAAVSQASQPVVEASEAAKAVPAPAEPASAEEPVPASQASEAVIEATADTAEAAAATGATAPAAKAAAKPTRRASPRTKRTPTPTP